MASDPIISTTAFDGQGGGELVTTTYHPSVSGSGDEAPREQMIHIREILYLDSPKDQPEEHNIAEIVNAFIQNLTPPKVYLDAEEGEVVRVVTYDYGTTNVEVNITEEKGDTYTTLPPDDVRNFQIINHVNAAVESLTSSHFPGITQDTVRRQMSPIMTYQKSERTEVIQGGLPRMITLPGGSRPLIRIYAQQSRPALPVYVLEKCWGYIYSSASVEVSTDGTKGFFKTVGKILKVISTIAKVALPVVSLLARQNISTPLTAHQAGAEMRIAALHKRTFGARRSRTRGSKLRVRDGASRRQSAGPIQKKKGNRSRGRRSGKK